MSRAGPVLALIAAAWAGAAAARDLAGLATADRYGLLPAARAAYPDDLAAFLAEDASAAPAAQLHTLATRLKAQHGDDALHASPPALRAYFDAYLAFLRQLARNPATCAYYIAGPYLSPGPAEAAAVAAVDESRIDAAAVALMAAGAADPQDYPAPDHADTYTELDRWDAAGTTPAPARAAFRHGNYAAPDYCVGHVGFYAALAGETDALADRVRWIIAEATFTGSW